MAGMKLTVAQVLHLKNCTDKLVEYDDMVLKTLQVALDQDQFKRFQEKRYEVVNAINSLVSHVQMLMGAEFQVKG